MGVCHECKCFYCENLGTKKCPINKVCSTCYKGVNSRNYRIIHCDRHKPYVPVAVTTPKGPEKKQSKRVFHFRKGKKHK